MFYATIFVFLVLMLSAALIIGLAFTLNVNTQLVKAGDEVIQEHRPDIINNIEDEEVKNAILELWGDTQQSQADQIDVIGTIWQYIYIIIPAVTLFSIFLLARRNVEVNTGGGIA